MWKMMMLADTRRGYDLPISRGKKCPVLQTGLAEGGLVPVLVIQQDLASILGYPTGFEDKVQEFDLTDS